MIPIGLGLVDVLVNEDSINAAAKLERRIVVLGSQFKVQAPNTCPGEYSLNPPTELETKTRRSPPPEMEQSEDYTCVILHGPNPRTTHIFDNCVIIESSDDDDDRRAFAADHFLSFCCRCKRRIGSREDVYMYRGEKAFCSDACRGQEISSEEEKEKHAGPARNPFA